MSTITKERVAEFIKNPLNNGLTRGEQMELARIALASLEAEPVAWLLSGGGAKNHVSFDSGNAYADPLREVTPLYTAPPAPVSVPDGYRLQPISEYDAMCAAMLQAEPVSNSDELPLDYLQGHKDGLEWAAQLAEANHPQTGDWLYDDPIDLARAIRKGPDMPTVQGGNSPVTPDGWVACSERMPEDDDFVYIWPRPDFGVELHVGQYCECHPKGDGWYAQVYEQNYGIEWCPITVTHWMPLPNPPKE
ncbi:TPA: DUF551 domain-containing protein [Enterobacter roggenkampii]|nr:DUF551 domain-containing protein [Enterobacter roggenkampii]HDR2534422.1 DUF551 domain-containing protein [Enterobacter roggenkampii]